MASSNRFLTCLSIPFVLLVLASCAGDERNAHPVANSADCAVDLDHDGYGPGCAKGLDCNDHDALVHDGCAACATPAEDCACLEGSSYVECIEHGPVHEETMLCHAGRRYCRDGKWSGCEGISTFEVHVSTSDSDDDVEGGASTSLRSTSAALISSDASVVCDPCSPACNRLTDALQPASSSDPNLTYPPGGGITITSTVVNNTPGMPVVDNTTCKIPCAACTATGPYDYNCDGLPDQFEPATCAMGDIACTSVRPFTTDLPSISLMLGPGGSATSSLNVKFSSRTVDLYFLFDTATTSSTVINAISNSLTTGGPFYYDTDPALTNCATKTQGIIGSLQCVLNNAGFGLGFSRDVPFEGPVNGVNFGWDHVAGATSDPSNPFGDFMFEHLAPISTTPSSVSGQLWRLKLRADPDPTGPNGQIQGLYAVASGKEAFVGYDRPAIGDGACSGTSFGYPCFRTKDATNAATTPIIVLVTGKPLYDGPTIDWENNAITMPTAPNGSPYPARYPQALHAGKVHVGSYPGYIEMRQVLATDFEKFPTAYRTDLQTDPATLATTPAPIGSVHDNLLTFTGDTSKMTADVDASFFSCNGVTQITGNDAVHYFALNPTVTGGKTYVHLSSEGSRFSSLLGIIKADLTAPPTLIQQNVTSYCCPDPTYPDPAACTGAAPPAGCCLAPSLCGATAGSAYNVGTITPGTNAVLTGNLVQTGSFPADLLECFTQPSVSQCGQLNKASDIAPNSVFQFQLSQDMSLKLWSGANYNTDMALFIAKPNGVTDVKLGANPPESYNVGTINDHAYRFLGDGACVGGTNVGVACVNDSQCPGSTCGSATSSCNGFALANNNNSYASKAVFNTATDMTPTNSSYACTNLDGNGQDIEFPFHVSKDNTVVSLSTSGGQPQLELQSNTVVAVRQLTPPGAVSSTATGSYDDFASAWSVAQADFTPIPGGPNQGNRYADVTSSIMGAGSTLQNLTLLTNYYNAYRCTADDISLCPLPTSPGQSSCLGTGVNQVTDQWLASTPDVVYKFTTTTTRDLKISAVGTDGAKHHLVLFDPRATNGVPPGAGAAPSSVTEPLISSVTNAGTFAALAPGETSSMSTSFTLASVSNSSTSFALPTVSTSSASFSLPTVSSSSTSFTLPGSTSSNASFSLAGGSSGAATFDLAASSSSNQAFSLSAPSSVGSSFDLAAGSSSSQTFNLAAATLTPNFGSNNGDNVTTPFPFGTLGGGDQITSISTTLSGAVDYPNKFTAGAATCVPLAANSTFSRDNVYTFTASAVTTARITLTASGTTGNTNGKESYPIFQVFSDSSLTAAGTKIACTIGLNGTPGTGSFTTTASTTYYVVVSRYKGSNSLAANYTGAYTVDVSMAALASGNTVPAPLALGTLSAGTTLGVSGTGLTTNNFAITANYDSATDYVSCNTTGNTPPDQVFSFTAGAAAGLTVTATASSFSGGNPAVVVYADNGSGGLGTQLGSCATGTSATVTGVTTSGKTYYVIVSGSVTAAKGTYGLTVALDSPAGGDTVASALSLGSVVLGQNLTVTGTGLTTNNSVINANYDSTTDYVSCNTPGNTPPDQVFSFSSPSAGSLTVTATASSFAGGNPAVVVYADNGSGGLGTQLGSCATGTSATVMGTTTAGKTYYAIVSGSVTAAKGSYTLSIALDSLASGDTVASPLVLGTLSAGKTLTVSGSGLTTNSSAITADNDGSISCNGTGSPDQVLSFTANATAGLTITATGTSFAGGNPAVAVYADNGSGGLGTQLGTCNTGAPATVTGMATSGKKYYVLVSGSAASAKGTYILSLALAAPAGGDAVASALALGAVVLGETLTVGGTGLTTNNTVINANYDSPTDYVSCNTVGNTPADQVFSFTTSSTGSLTVTATASSFSGGNPALVVYADNGSGGLGTQLGSCTTGSTATVLGTATAGKTYYAIVSGSVTAAKGTYGLTVSLDSTASGNLISSSLGLGSIAGGQTATVSGSGLTTRNSAIASDYDASITCNGVGSPDQVLSFTASSAATLTATATASSFSGGNPTVAVFADNGTGGLGTQLGSCQTGSTATVTGGTTAGKIYYILISGSASAASGTYNLSVALDSAAGGDSVSSALSLGSLASATTVNASGAGLTTSNSVITADNDASISCNGAGSPDQVVSFTATQTGTLTVTASGASAALFTGGNPAVAVYADNGSGGLGTQLGSCSTAATATVTGTTTAGTKYYVLVSGSAASAKGQYNLTVALDPRASGDTVASPLALGSLASATTLNVSGNGLTTNNAVITADNDASISCNGATSPDQVLSFTATEATTLTVTATGSSWSTGTPALAVFADNGSGGLGTQLGICSAAASATVTGTTTAGTKYYVLVSGSVAGAKGQYSLSVALDARAGGDTVASPLALGSLATASLLTVSGTGLTTNNGAITADNDASIACNGAGSPDQVLSFTAAQVASLTVTATGAGWSTGTPALAVFADNGSGALGTQLGSCNAAATATVSGTTVAGQKYYILVSGSAAAATGSYNVSVALAAQASGDTTASPLALGSIASGETLTVGGTGLTTNNGTITANYDSGTDYVSCNAAGDTPPDQVLSFTAGVSSSLTVTATASAFAGGNPAVVVYADNGAGGLGTRLGSCATGATATVTGNATAGQLYYIVISGSATAAKGTYGLTVQLNSNRYDTALTAGTLSLAATGAASLTNSTAGIGATSSTAGRTVSSDYDSSAVTCNTGTSSKDQVYKVTNVNTLRDLSFLLTPTAFAGAVSVWSDGGGTLGTNLGCSASSTSGATIELAVQPTSSTLYVIVAGNGNADAGTFTLQASPGLHDTVAGAHDLGTIDDTSATVLNDTTQPGVSQNYDTTPDYVSCNKSSGSAASMKGYDQVFKFHVASAAKTRATVTLTPSSAWYGVVQVRAASGATFGSAIGCDAGTGASTTTRTVSFNPSGDNTDYYVIVTGYSNADRGAYTLTVADAQNGNYGCSTSLAPQRAVITVKGLPAGTYYVFLKMDVAGVIDPDPNSVALTIEDASWAAALSTYYCELNNYKPYELAFRSGNNTTLSRTDLTLTLDKGDYVAILKRERGTGGNATDPIKLIMRDVSYQPDVYGCHNNGLPGSFSTGVVDYFTFGPAANPPSDKLPACQVGYTAPCPGHENNYYLVMRANNAADVPLGANPNNPYTVHIADGTLATPIASCSNGNVPDTFDGWLDNGNYFAVVKGLTTTDKGLYQLTVGAPLVSPTSPTDMTTVPVVPWSTANFAAERRYSDLLDMLQNPGAGRPPIRVVSIQDGKDDTTKKQLDRLAYDSTSMAINNTPLVTQIDDTGGANDKTVFSSSKVGYGITRSIQELAQSLVMDVTAVLDPAPLYANPGFLVNITANGSEPLCMGGISADAKSWLDCHMTAMPNFTVSVENPPAPNNVRFKVGGYDMLLDLLGKVQIGNDPTTGLPLYRTYIVYQIPIHVDATATGGGGGGGSLQYQPSASYAQTLSGTKCLATETPQWRRLNWSASIPGDSSIEFKICTADTASAAAACTLTRMALVASGAPCTQDAQCAGGFCYNGEVCWYVEGPACSTDANCGTNGKCDVSTSACTWPGLPLDAGPAVAIGGGQSRDYTRVEVVLNATSNLAQAPTLTQWSLEYDCVGNQ